MIRTAVAAAALAVVATAGTIATGSAATDPCADVAQAQRALIAAQAQVEGHTAAYDIATDLNLANRNRIGSDLAHAHVAFAHAAGRYDAARDACAH